MQSHGKFCTYCNRKTRHERQGEGSICALCGTYSSPSQEEIAARNQRRASDEALNTIQSSRRIRDSVEREEAEKRFRGRVVVSAFVACIFLMAAIVGAAVWIFLN